MAEIQNQLKCSREEAESKLKDRIIKGESIIKLIKSFNINHIQNALFDMVKPVGLKCKKWHDYNIRLLNQLFPTDKLSKEYNPKNKSDSSHLNIILYGKMSDYICSIEYGIHELESIIEQLELIPLANENQNGALSMTVKNNKIFIVHGRDDLAKTSVARFLEKLGFEAIILHEQASNGNTIIEKIESYSDVGFAIILYTPCDKGCLASETNTQPRARQNVVFEHGYFIGKLGRNNVCALVKGDIEKPNDISGVVYIALDNHDAWQMAVAKELRNAGYAVDMNKLIA